MLVTSHFNRSNPHQLARHVAATDGHRQTLPQSFTAAMLPRGVLGLIALILATPVTTSADYTPTTTLGRAGLTENQQRTGDAVQTVCGGLLGTQNVRTLNQPESQLLAACGSMVHNARVVLAEPGATVLTLGLDQAGLAAAVQTVATEELAATKSMATELNYGQIKAGVARLNALRGGSPIGALGAAFNPFASLATVGAAPDSQQPITGGAAGDSVVGEWAIFANANAGFGDRETTSNEDGFDYDVWGLNLGGDYRLNVNTVFGGLVSYTSNETDFDTTAAVPSGGIDSESWGVSLYGTHYADQYYVDGLIGYTHAEYDITRQILLTNTGTPASTVSSIATGDTDSDGFTVSIGGGLDLQSNNVSYGPYVRLTYQETEIDGYAETGSGGLDLTVYDQDWESLTSVLGVQSSYPMSQNWGVLTPQVRLGWIHEFSNDSQIMSAVYTNDPNRNVMTAVTDDPDRNYFELGLGVSAVLSNGLQVFVDYQTLLGHAYIDDHSFTVGMRQEL